MGLNFKLSDSILVRRVCGTRTEAMKNDGNNTMVQIEGMIVVECVSFDSRPRLILSTPLVGNKSEIPSVRSLH